MPFFFFELRVPVFLRYLQMTKWRLACVAWRFCRAGRASGEAAKFARALPKRPCSAAYIGEKVVLK